MKVMEMMTQKFFRIALPHFPFQARRVQFRRTASKVQKVFLAILQNYTSFQGYCDLFKDLFCLKKKISVITIYNSYNAIW